MLVELAFDGDQRVGYCITSLDAEKTGEVESIYVLEAYRGRGIGNALMLSSLAWMQQNGATKRTVIVAAGNEQVFSFYERYGFHIRKTMLEQV